MIEFKNVRKVYGKKVVLKDLSFTIQDGEFVVLIGPSGCGKTTTLKMINRLIEPDQGQILLDGKDAASMDKVQMRRRIGYVIQQIGLFPNMTVAQNIAVVPKMLKVDKIECDRIVRRLMEMVNLSYGEYAHKYPRELSGGQQQRIGVLRALAADPPVVLMDEPFSALDPMTRASLQEEIKNLQQKLNKTIVFVSHDMDVALNLADTIIFMEEGVITQMGPPGELLLNPANDLVRSFMGKRSGYVEDTLTAGDIMQPGVTKCWDDLTIRKCADLMGRRKVDTMILTDADGKYEGVVTIEEVRRRRDEGALGQLVRDIALESVPVVHTNDSVRVTFEKMMDSKYYVLVLDARDRVAGIVTKSMMARALADALWGEKE